LNILGNIAIFSYLFCHWVLTSVTASTAQWWSVDCPLSQETLVLVARPQVYCVMMQAEFLFFQGFILHIYKVSMLNDVKVCSRSTILCSYYTKPFLHILFQVTLLHIHSHIVRYPYSGAKYSTLFHDTFFLWGSNLEGVIGVGGGGGMFSRRKWGLKKLRLWYIIRTFVNVAMYSQHNNNNNYYY
jgi:hypothetical protein